MSKEVSLCQETPGSHSLNCDYFMDLIVEGLTPLIFSFRYAMKSLLQRTGLSFLPSSLSLR